MILGDRAIKTIALQTKARNARSLSDTAGKDQFCSVAWRLEVLHRKGRGGRPDEGEPAAARKEDRTLERILLLPHLVVEATPKLAVVVDFKAVFASIHTQLAEKGYARLEDLKSRVLTASPHLAADDPDGEFLVARLVTTNPRPKAVEQEMAQIIHDALREAVLASSQPFWWQCCVLIETFDRQDYIRSDSRR